MKASTVASSEAGTRPPAPAARDQVSSLDPLFRPATVAVVGASRTPGSIGYEIVDNLIRHRFAGALYPVNPRARAVHSIPCHPSISAIGEQVDLAVIAVPKEGVLAVLEECGRAGVPAAIVISAGFKEVGGEGVERERALTECARRHGMRLVGPNCLGVLNTSPESSLNATFAPSMPPAGPVSFMSQSGAMGVTILDYAAEYGIGIRHFVSVGNKADVSGNDLIEYWGEDEGTRVILMYLESFGNPRKFTSLARSVTRRKPVVAVKSGRTAAGALAASSHTGALAGLDAATDALLAQCGVIRVDTVQELFDLAMAFSELPLPEGDGVAIVTNAGGPGIIIADACEAAGLAVPALEADTRERLRGVLVAEASTRNPVDMVASATAEQYRLALEAVLGDPNVHAAIAAFVPPLGVRQLDVARAIVDAVRSGPAKPVLAVLMGREGLPQGRAELNAAGMPAYIFPESAARALAAMVRHRRWIDRPVGETPHFEVDDDGVRAILALATREGREQLSQDEAAAVMAAYGLPMVERRLAGSEDQAAAAALELGLPAALKVSSPDIVHKTDIGGVELDLRDEEGVRAGYRALMERVRSRAPEARIEGVLVEPFTRGGIEVIVGMAVHPGFGPVVMFGLGGIHVEALGDVAFRIAPVSDVDVREMVGQIRGARILRGMRGEPPADIPAIEEAIQRVSQLAAEHQEILEVEMNPLVVFESGALALDARIRIRAGAGRG